VRTLDLAALSRFQHDLNARASDDAIRRFNLLGLTSQCEIAAAWAASRDFTIDAAAADRDREWCTS
jgi:hypothetical protein